MAAVALAAAPYVGATVATVLGAAATGAVWGAVIGAGVSMARNEDVLTGAMNGALVGGITAGVVRGVALPIWPADPAVTAAATGTAPSGIATPDKAIGPTDIAAGKASTPAAGGGTAITKAPVSDTTKMLYGQGLIGLGTGAGQYGAALVEGEAAKEAAKTEAEALAEARAEKLKTNVPATVTPSSLTFKEPIDWWNKYASLPTERLTGYKAGLLQGGA